MNNNTDQRLNKMGEYLKKEFDNINKKLKLLEELKSLNEKLEDISDILGDKAMCIDDLKKEINEGRQSNN